MSDMKRQHKAVGLLSGGLDSAIACRLIQEQGIEVHVVHIEMPWGCGKPLRVRKLCETLGVSLKVIPLADDYLQVLKKPKHGFGSAHNPCVDCHIYMVKKAADYMKEIGADFIFTGEVVGQRPMSQRRVCLDWVENDAGVPGQLLRPLSAQLLPPTVPEDKGIVERSKLFGISGRSRKVQYELVEKMGLQGFGAPGGGCLLTEKHFGRRMKDVLEHGCETIEATAVLGLGRYFRINDTTFILLGRDDDENEKLIAYALPDDHLLRPVLFPGPLALVRGEAVSDKDLEIAAGLIQYFSKLRGEPGVAVNCWIKFSPDNVREVVASVPDEAFVQKMWM